MRRRLGGKFPDPDLWGVGAGASSSESRPLEWPSLHPYEPSHNFFLSPSKVASSSNARRITNASNDNNGGVLSRVSSAFSESPVVYKGKKAACNATYVTKKLLHSTGKAAWIAGTTFLILVVPLIVEMDRDQQLNELVLQHANLLSTPTHLTAPK